MKPFLLKRFLWVKIEGKRWSEIMQPVTAGCHLRMRGFPGSHESGSQIESIMDVHGFSIALTYLLFLSCFFWFKIYLEKKYIQRSVYDSELLFKQSKCEMNTEQVNSAMATMFHSLTGMSGKTFTTEREIEKHLQQVQLMFYKLCWWAHNRKGLKGSHYLRVIMITFLKISWELDRDIAYL